MFRSGLFIRNSDAVRSELIEIVNEVNIWEERIDEKPSTSNASLHIIYSVLLLDGQTELETLRKIRKSKCIPTMVTTLWKRSQEDYDLHTVGLELMFEVCRSERLSEEDLGM